VSYLLILSNETRFVKSVGKYLGRAKKGMLRQDCNDSDDCPEEETSLKDGVGRELYIEVDVWPEVVFKKYFDKSVKEAGMVLSDVGTKKQKSWVNLPWAV